MAKNLTPDLQRKAIALFAMIVTLLWQTSFSQVGVIVLSGFAGYFIYKKQTFQNDLSSNVPFPISRRTAYICLLLFFGLLIVLPVLREVTTLNWIAMFDSFYRSGSLVFGGGHVVLPLLEREFVQAGLLNNEQFLAGYGATQAVPGPLFTFSAYIGTVMNGWVGGLVATFAIFLPAILLVFGILPFWNSLRHHPKIKSALMGVNAAVVGILISAFYDPIWTSSIFAPIDFALASILFSMFMFWKLPPWIIVLTGAIGGSIISLM